MDHNEAVKEMAVERYVLGEMTPEQRSSFEAHYFDCNECEAALRDAETFAAGVKQLGRQQPFRQRRPLKWTLPLAAGWLVAVMGMGGMYMRMQTLMRPALAQSIHVRGEVRDGGIEEPLKANRRISLTVDIPLMDGAVSYRMELRGAKDSFVQTLTPEQARKNEAWVLSPLPPGTYSLVIEGVDRGGKRTEVMNVPIRVEGS